jgi:acylphosphatase
MGAVKMPFTRPMEVAAERSQARLIITGRVQGVYFRASTVEEARRLDLTGWVMNRSDGSVEVLAEGKRTKLEEFIRWCHHGPKGASVEQVQLEWRAFRDEFQGFRIKR